MITMLLLHIYLHLLRTVCFATNDEIFRIIYKFKAISLLDLTIGPRLVKAVADEIADPLCYLFNLSFLTGVVPNALKIAKVIPIYKKGEKSSIENYRPISLLSVFDKILEKLMYGWLYNYLRDNNILYDYQFWFSSSSLYLPSINRCC